MTAAAKSSLPRGRPRIIGLAAVLLVAAGIVAIPVGVATTEWLVVAGVGMLVAGPLVWIGSRVGKWGAVVAGLLALVPGAYGVFGLTVVLQDFGMCRSRPTASIVATSYPGDFCERVNWFTHFGTGFALVGVGLIGIAVLVAVVRESDYFDRVAS